MKGCSTREAARKLRIALVTLQRYISSGRLNAPKLQTIGGIKVRLWTARDIARARKQLRKSKR